MPFTKSPTDNVTRRTLTYYQRLVAKSDRVRLICFVWRSKVFPKIILPCVARRVVAGDSAGARRYKGVGRVGRGVVVGVSMQTVPPAPTAAASVPPAP